MPRTPLLRLFLLLFLVTSVQLPTAYAAIVTGQAVFRSSAEADVHAQDPPPFGNQREFDNDNTGQVRRQFGPFGLGAFPENATASASLAGGSASAFVRVDIQAFESSGFIFREGITRARAPGTDGGQAIARSGSGVTLSITFDTAKTIKTRRVHSENFFLQLQTLQGSTVNLANGNTNPSLGGASAFVGGVRQASDRQYEYLWYTTSDAFPGDRPNPFQPQPVQVDEFNVETESVVERNLSTLSEELFAPESSMFNAYTIGTVEGGIGDVEAVWMEESGAAGYGFTVEDSNRFTSFLVPESLTLGNSTLDLHVEGIIYELMAGETFDFTTIDPVGVSSFLLLGIDGDDRSLARALSDDSFLFGATFANPGITRVGTFAVTPVPEPSSLASLAVAGLIAARRSRCRRNSNES